MSRVGFGVDHRHAAIAYCVRPRSARLEPVSSLRGVKRWFLAYTFPSRQPDPNRLAVPVRPGVVGVAYPPASASPETNCPQLQPSCYDNRQCRSLTSLDSTAPRGAPTRYEKTATVFRAGLHIAGIFIWSAR